MSGGAGRPPGGRVAVIDYAGGNLASAARALAEAAARTGIHAVIECTDEPARIATSDRVVLPGQGAFNDCRRGLDAHPGLLAALADRVGAGAPFLGICVGMQLMAERGDEHGGAPGLGWVHGVVTRMAPVEAGEPDETPFRLPQVGWNRLALRRSEHALLDGIANGDHAYFVHSFALSDGDDADLLATTDYRGERVAMVARGNRAGTQFHVEKSQDVGLRILANFLRWDPAG